MEVDRIGTRDLSPYSETFLDFQSKYRKRFQKGGWLDNRGFRARERRAGMEK